MNFRKDEIIGCTIILKCCNFGNYSRGWSGFEADGSAEGVFDGLMGCDAVEAGGADDGSGEGVNVGAPEGPEAVGDLAEDDAGPERAFGAVVGGWNLAIGHEGEELAAPSLGLAHELDAGRGGHRHGDEAVEPSLCRGTILCERGVLEVGSPTPDRDGPAEEAAQCRSEGGFAGIDGVLRIAQHMGEAELVGFGAVLLR